MRAYFIAGKDSSGEMADSEWARCLSPHFVEVVDSLAQLDGSRIFDFLLAKSLLTIEQYDDTFRDRKSSSLKDIIRQVLARLMQKPSPSFSQFCEALKKIENGDTVLRILANTNSEVMSSAATENDRPVASTAKRLEPSSKRPALATSLVTYSESDSTTTDDQGTDSEVIWIFVINSLKRQYKLQKSVIQQVIGHIVKRSYGNFRFREKFVEKLYKTGSVSVQFGQSVSFRIVFPELKGAKDFERHYDEMKKMITVHLERLEKKEIEILVKDGSCILEITVPGDAFINFVVSLAYPNSLNFLRNVSAPVLINIGNLEQISLDQLSDASVNRFMRRYSERICLGLCKAIPYRLHNEQ